MMFVYTVRIENELLTRFNNQSSAASETINALDQSREEAEKGIRAILKSNTGMSEFGHSIAPVPCLLHIRSR